MHWDKETSKQFGTNALQVNAKTNQIFAPDSLKEELTEWYHKNLKYLGGNRMCLTIKEMFYWKGMKEHIKQHAKTCETCQLCKLPKTNQGKLEKKNNIESMKPWRRVYVDTIGPWEVSINETVKGKRGRNKKVQTKVATIYALTMIDEASSWPKIIRIADKTSYEASKTFDREWLCRHPRPSVMIHDNGPEFTSEFLELLSSYGIKSQPTTVKNPRPNIVERMHETLSEMIRTEDFTDLENLMREVDTLLSACAWALRFTASVVTRRSPGHLIFNQDMIMGVEVDLNWSNVLRAKEKIIKKNNTIENKKRTAHQYQVGDYVKILHRKNSHMRPTKLSQPNEGPHQIIEIFGNNVKIQRGNIREEISITRIAPYFHREE